MGFLLLLPRKPPSRLRIRDKDFSVQWCTTGSQSTTRGSTSDESSKTCSAVVIINGLFQRRESVFPHRVSPVLSPSLPITSSPSPSMDPLCRLRWRVKRPRGIPCVVASRGEELGCHGLRELAVLGELDNGEFVRGYGSRGLYKCWESSMGIYLLSSSSSFAVTRRD